MTRAEVALLLTAAAGRDQRTIGDADVLAWYEDIGDLNYADAREALVRHYRESTDRVMPAHIRRLVKAIREERRRITSHEIRELPGRYEPDWARDMRIRDGVAHCRDVLAVVMQRLDQVRHERDPDAAIARLDDALGEMNQPIPTAAVRPPIEGEQDHG